MTVRSTISLLSSCAAISLAGPAIALAGGGGSHHHALSIEETLQYWPHFLFFLFIFLYLTRKPFVNVWEARTIRIAEEATAGERRLAEAKDRLAFAKEQYANLQDQVAELKEKAATETENEVAALLKEATERAEKIAEQAESTIKAEQHVRENELQQEFADKVITKAREKLSSTLTGDEDKALRESLVKGLSTLQN